MNEIARTVGVPRHAVMQKIESLVEEREALRKRIEKLERSLATGSGPDDFLADARQVEGVTVVVRKVDASSVDGLRFMADGARKSLPSGVAVLGTVIDEKPMFIALVTKDLTSRGLHAGNLLKKVATVAGGNAGGRPDMAQGGGKDVSKLDEALGTVPDAVKEMLNGD
jgi:alanyl-tRNA synthetase